MNIVTVKINGIEYNLKGDEQEEYLHKVASYVDKKVKNIMDNNAKLSTSSAAILSAVNVVDDMLKRQKEYEELVNKVNQMEKAQKSYMEQIDSLKKQLKHMEEYNDELQLKLKSNSNNQHLEQKKQDIEKLTKELELTQETAQKYIKENAELKAENKEYKFQVQSAKYKMIDLQHRLVENQINLAKEKKQKHPFLNDSTK
ncbi:cell division protein ZapA [Clostridium thailandense]|uniref:Cell division protein ZapA n=1 Tax=Clostridium thailandense TaxID=2794346 RepID=A0A949THB9_9CLOT|nr:cell division protein ZapA [Clostridium thailandense]MBV7272799.1 cell division protein ZapA [Clostridium thailandense]MCH5137660.1 cell division protein ZapA [Clostridiaceae bacterium UIB06]